MPDDLAALTERYDQQTAYCAELQRALDAAQRERAETFRAIERAMKRPVG